MSDRFFPSGVILLFSFNLLLAGCTSVGVAVGAGAAAGSIILETRSLDDSIHDRAIQLAINQKLADRNFETFKAVSINVVEGRVMLTGIVENPDERLEVARLSWDEEGVEEVINEIRVAPSIDLINVSGDVWIKAQLVSAITFDKFVLATNYEISVVGGRVYLFGIAEDDQESLRVIAHAREVPAVRRVISHMRNKNDPLRLKRLRRLASEEN